MTGPAKRREAVEQVRKLFKVSERRACRVIRQARSTQRWKPEERNGEEPLPPLAAPLMAPAAVVTT